MFCQTPRIPNDFFYVAAKKLASLVSEADLDEGALYPDIGKIREISIKIAQAICERAETQGLNGREKPEDGWEEGLRSGMWEPNYEEYV